MKHSDFDLRWPSSEPRRLLLQLPLRTSRQLLRSSMIKRSPRFCTEVRPEPLEGDAELLAPFTPIVHVCTAERPNSANGVRVAVAHQRNNHMFL
jgi:hypothetical protein